MKRAGFTMIELIFVIVILGILAAVALPKFAGVAEQARAGKCQAFVGTLNRTVFPAIWSEAVTAPGATDASIQGEFTAANILAQITPPEQCDPTAAKWATLASTTTAADTITIDSQTYNLSSTAASTTAAPQINWLGK